MKLFLEFSQMYINIILSWRDLILEAIVYQKYLDFVLYLFDYQVLIAISIVSVRTCPWALSKKKFRLKKAPE